MPRKILLGLLIPAILILTSCTAKEPNSYQHQVQQQLQQLNPWAELGRGQEVSRLTELLPSSTLELLVQEALQANPDLQQTLLTLKIRQEEYRQTIGRQRPEVAAELTADKEQNSKISYGSAVSISWEVDLWHKLANSTAAAAKDVDEQQALWQSARDTLAAEVMQSWLELISLKSSIAIQEKYIACLTSHESFIRQRYRNGLKTLEDLDSARGSTASARASLEAYREDFAQAERSLQSLLGRGSSTALSLPESYPRVLLPLADLPQQTLQRRPDLKAAYLAIEAAELRSKVAYQELLPSISLQAALEDVANAPRAVLFNDPVWSLLGQLTAPLYQGGQLKSAARIAELETAQTYETYRATLLSAVQDVENAISQERSLARQQSHLETALAAARSTLGQYQRGYRAGLYDLLDLLTVQQQTFDLEQQLNDLIYARLSNRIDLGLALGLGVPS